jgi:hypothetical protein
MSNALVWLLYQGKFTLIGDDPNATSDNLNVASRLHSTNKTEVKTEEHILPRGIFFLKYRRLNNE